MLLASTILLSNYKTELFNSFFELFYALIQQIFVHSLPLYKYFVSH